MAPSSLFGMFSISAFRGIHFLLSRFGFVGSMHRPSLSLWERAFLYKRTRFNNRQQYNDCESRNCQYREDLPDCRERICRNRRVKHSGLL